MSSLKTRKTHLINQDEEPPEKKLISEGDLLIKILHNKQVSTKTTLSEQLSHSKEFVRSVDLIPIEHHAQGSRSLEDICLLEKQRDEVAILKSSGVSEDDINLYLDYKKIGVECLNLKHKLLSKETILDKICSIEKCLLDSKLKFETDTKDSFRNVSRHKKELLAVKPDSVETKLLKFVLENEPTKEKLQHPLDELPEIEENFMDNINQPNLLPYVNKIRKKARNLANQINKYNEPQVLESPKNIPKKVNSFVTNSKWDVKEKTEEVPFIRMKEKDKKVYTCSPQNYYTIRDSKIVPLNKQPHAPENSASSNNDNDKKRLTTEEIKQIPKFQNYESGVISKVLYLKNLANSVTEDDLKVLFLEFAADISSIRVMKGKMRGQAFVQFSCDHIAQKALEELNGSFVKKRPVIMQFGKDPNKEGTKQSGFG